MGTQDYSLRGVCRLEPTIGWEDAGGERLRTDSSGVLGPAHLSAPKQLGSPSMTSIDAIQPAFEALDACTGALGELDMKCCDPGRSPRMVELGMALTEARVKLRAATVDPTTGATAALETLEEAGAQVGRLQVGCCAPGRLPLYNEMLENLTKAQLVLASAVKT